MAAIEWGASAVGRRDLLIRLNGATTIVNFIGEAVGNINHRYFIATLYDLAVTDYVECRVYQTTGAGISVQASAQYSPEFMMQRIP
ncbi:hypothetical protein ES703_102341 [subsurface metagenome]